MSLRFLVLCFCLTLGAELGHAATSRDELLFAVSAALKTGDRAALRRCFNLQGVTPDDQAALSSTIDQICAWPLRHAFVSDRKDRGPMEITRDGRTFVLNGDWTFQIHLHKGEPPSKGFVFPAGQAADGRFLILASIPK